MSPEPTETAEGAPMILPPIRCQVLQVPLLKLRRQRALSAPWMNTSIDPLAVEIEEASDSDPSPGSASQAQPPALTEVKYRW